MSFFLFGVAIAVAILDWILVALDLRRAEYIAKPTVMLALLAWLWQNGGFSSHLTWFAVGLVFSLAGDIFLMLPREQFIAGLVSFLFAHLAYIVGFNPTFPPLNLASLLLTFIVGLATTQVYRRIAASLEASGNGILKPPVLVYSTVISLMLLSALLTLLRPDWHPATALLASSGALLFILSDTILAWNKFVTPVRYGSATIMITYHLGQMLIILGAALQLLSYP